MPEAQHRRSSVERDEGHDAVAEEAVFEEGLLQALQMLGCQKCLLFNLSHLIWPQTPENSGNLFDKVFDLISG
jgi:hypothetical protein